MACSGCVRGARAEGAACRRPEREGQGRGWGWGRGWGPVPAPQDAAACPPISRLHWELACAEADTARLLHLPSVSHLLSLPRGTTSRVEG